MHLSFCGCGFLGIYQLGVVHGLMKHGPRLLDEVRKVAGASAGALAATVLVCAPTKLADCKEFSLDLAGHVRRTRFGAMNPKFNLLQPIEDFLNTSLPDDSYERASGTLHVSVTSVHKGRLRHELVSQFTSNKQLVETLLVSCSIPVYTGIKMPRKNDIMYLDGGFTNNLYKFDEGRTITVAPFAGKIDIAPTDKTKHTFNITVSNMNIRINELNMVRVLNGLHPPVETRLLSYFDRGFIDCINFLKMEQYCDNLSRTSQ